MHTIFERLVEELRAWHLFNDNKDYSLVWELPGTSTPENGKTPRHHRDLQPAPPQPNGVH
jgi:hypothetical protein